MLLYPRVRYDRTTLNHLVIICVGRKDTALFDKLKTGQWPKVGRVHSSA